MAQDSNIDFDALQQQMDVLAQQGDAEKANQLLQSLAQAPSGAAARPQRNDPLMDEVRASNQAASAPVPSPDLNAPSGPMPSLPTRPDTMQSRPMVEGGVPAGQSSVPTPRMGGLPGLLADLLSPRHRAQGTLQGSLAPSKLDSFETFLSSFVQALGQGFQAAGHGPGATMRGAGAAMVAPYEQAVRQYGMQQQGQQTQAQIEGERLKAQLTRAQIEQMQTSVPVRMPDGTTVYAPTKDVGHLLGNVAGAQGKISAAQIAADNKLSVESMKEHLANGKVVKTLPAQDRDGNLGVMGYNAQGQPVGFMQGALPPSAYMPKTSSTTDYIQTDGGLMAIPKSTATAPQLPSGVSNLPAPIQQKIASGRAAKAGASGQLPPQVQNALSRGGSGAQLVTGPDGKPVFSKSGPTSMTGVSDPFGNTVGTTESGVTLTKPEYLSAQKTFNKDYVEPINRLAKTQAEFESIKNDPDQTGAQKVSALLAAVGISGDALQGKGFRISNEVINEHANARNVWQGFVQKWNRIAGSGGPITSQQIADYTKIAQGVVHDSYVQAAREARRQGLPVDFLPKATSQGQKADDGILKIYIDSANGDVQKAHKALTSAGWR